MSGLAICYFVHIGNSAEHLKGNIMALVTLKKATVTATGLAKARKSVANITFGNRAGASPELTRELLAFVAFALTVPGKSVEVTDIARAIASKLDGDHSGHYHLIWTRTNSHESKVGAKCRVTMFTNTIFETAKEIKGLTLTTSPGATGRVFITA